MSIVDRERVKSIFLHAADLSTTARAGFLDEACADDAALRGEVESLLDAEVEPVISSALAAVHRARERDLTGDDDTEADMPEQIGSYAIHRLLGVGGMGRVYLAEQDRPRRMVALKVVRPGVFSREMLRRFEHETQVLGRLRHPGVAQIHEAGMVEGTPFFAMEYVDGVELTAFAREHDLSLRDRLELVALVCDAVHHAHQKGVIHRDLKPANILVDAQGQPRILDFGVARASDSDIQATTLQTSVGQLVGTIPYMSPEQAGGETDEIDVRSDVYALGVILYELLGGRLPHECDEVPMHELVRRIRDVEPARLGALNRAARGDMETITHKALARDKERRYQSAADLGADIRRCLASEPIAARPPSTIYHARRFARRHKAVVGGGTAVFAVLIAAVIGMSWTLYKAKLDLERRAIMQYYMGLMQNAVYDGVEAGEDPTFFVGMLDRSAEGMERAIEARPATESEIRLNIADGYRAARAWPQAMRHAERAWELCIAEHGPEDGWTQWAEITVADALRGLERKEEALPRYRHCLDVYRDNLDWFDPDTPTALQGTVALLREAGRHDEARGELDATIAAYRQALERPGLSERAAERLNEWIEAAESLQIS
ncbi:MAG: serine/threonine protein kinase [Phycisphaerales bacterium]|nr:serine/threonine protein kinase [Phycisphaerales bacterium]